MTIMNTIPTGFTSLTPYLIVDNANEAIQFYKEAFKAEEVSRIVIPNQHKVLHAELIIGNAKLFVCDDQQDNCQQPIASPLHHNSTSVALHLYVSDVDATFAQAIAAGCIELKPVMDMFWGDRYGQLKDPYGHVWTLATRTREVSAEQIQQISEAIFAEAEHG